MEVINLLEFLNTVENIHSLEVANVEGELVDFLDLLSEDEQFTRKIDLGILYVSELTSNRYLIIDGLRRLLSLSLLLHAICECYKKTTAKNEYAIQTIRSKYLLSGDKAKLRLDPESQKVYDKIIFGERLSGKEKATSMFKLLHGFWLKIKEENLSASVIFKMLQKISVTLVETDNVNPRELYLTLNKSIRKLNQISLIEDYLKQYNQLDNWMKFKKVFKNSQNDIELFFKDFFITKFSFKEFDLTRLYEYFVNYCETLLEFSSAENIMQDLLKSAKMYFDIININFENPAIKNAMIQIKMHNGEDTFAYLLNVYGDYIEKNISEVTFLEILSTIDEYLKNRMKTPNSVNFNELITYLNAFMSCK
ncbi:MAG: hypothetical protein E7Z89_00585 [Cyanobacteria bacterium SIG28]|nr:hypothetical protein [Cyanobacteria bacterium SIG28]